jgi:hypothetical protein
MGSSRDLGLMREQEEVRRQISRCRMVDMDSHLHRSGEACPRIACKTMAMDRQFKLHDELHLPIACRMEVTEAHKMECRTFRTGSLSRCRMEAMGSKHLCNYVGHLRVNGRMVLIIVLQTLHKPPHLKTSVSHIMELKIAVVLTNL